MLIIGSIKIRGILITVKGSLINIAPVGVSIFYLRLI